MMLTRRPGHERGAALVEAALVLPIFLLLLFGIVDWSLFLRDKLAVTDSARVGVRTASALPRVEFFTRTTVEAIGKAGSAMPMRNLVEGRGFVLVYKANDRGFPGPNGSTTPSCTGTESTCDRYVWNGSQFVSTGGVVWSHTSVNACPTVADGGPPDSVGVYVQATHDRLSRFFGVSNVVSDRAVLRFEPKRRGQCS